MKLRKLYSNRPKVRPAIIFRDGLNVILGEIRDPKNRNKDTHNLGKSLLVQIIDFCLLKKQRKEHFLVKHSELFQDLIFYLEIETNSGKFVTVRRAVNTASKASFKIHDSSGQDFSKLNEDDWTHWQLSFKRSVQVLDGYLKLTSISPWSFRKIIGYSLRTQRDYDEPFKLSKFGGKHADWKPLLAHVIGLDAEPISRSYEIIDRLDNLITDEKRLAQDVSSVAESPDQLRGRLRLQEEAVEKAEKSVAEYDFEVSDAEINQELVDRIDSETAALNERRYYVTSHLDRIKTSQADRMTVDFASIRSVFEQAEIYFPEALVKQYSDLEAFTRAITAERGQYLAEERQELTAELDTITTRLVALSTERSNALATLSDAETFSKFRKLSARLVKQRTEVEVLREKTVLFDQLTTKRKEVRDLKQEREELIERIESNIRTANGKYGDIRKHFNAIIEEVIDRKASLYTNLNKEGNIEFHTEILDTGGHETSAGDGNTYSRLLCMAFDLAVARAYVKEPFPHFLYHDGALETLDDRKKYNLVQVFRDYAARGIQILITVIDSELPIGGKQLFSPDEVIMTLHDSGQNGRLFRMSSW